MANGQSSQAKAAIDRAVGQFHHASQSAAPAVNTACNDGLKNGSGFFHWLGQIDGSGAHWLATNFPIKAISGVLGNIAAIAGLLSLIPIPIFKEIMAGIALTATLGTLACDTVTALNDTYEGTFSWKTDGLNMGFDLISAIPGVSRSKQPARAGSPAAC